MPAGAAEVQLAAVHATDHTWLLEGQDARGRGRTARLGSAGAVSGAATSDLLWLRYRCAGENISLGPGWETDEKAQPAFQASHLVALRMSLPTSPTLSSSIDVCTVSLHVR